MAITDMRIGVVPSTAIKAPCRVATTANITLEGLQTIDGFAVVEGDRVLVKNQTSAVNNGIWIASTGVWSRAADANKTGDLVKCTSVFVADGSVNGGTLFVVTTSDPISIGTTSITFESIIDFLDIDGIVDPRWFGATADGSTDDRAALANALATGKKVYLAPWLTYAFGSQLTPPSNGGFVGGGKLKMLTGTGKFDKADYTGGRATNKVGILIDGKTNVTVEAIIEMETNAGIRTCNPISVVSSTNIHIDVEVSGFKEAQYGLVSWDTNVGGFVKLYAHDCNPASNTLPSLQLTALSIDADRVASVNSTGLIFDAIVKNVLPVDAAAIAYGYQSDAVNIQSQGYSGIIGRVFADTVGEALDVFGDGNNIIVVARNCYEYGVKLIHGAENNLIYATIDNTRRAAVVLGGSNTSTKTVSHNRVYATARRVGEIASLPTIAAVATDGTSATYKPEKNYVEITAFGNGTNMHYVVYEDSGSNNVFIADGDGWATQFGVITGSAGTGNNRSVIRRQRRAYVRAHIGTATTVTAGSTVPFDTETVDATGEYDPTTGIFTARSACRLRVKAQLRSGGIPTLQHLGMTVTRSGTEIARSVAFNYASTTQEAWAQVEAEVTMDAGQTVNCGTLYSPGGSIAVTNQAQYSYLEIDEI